MQMKELANEALRDLYFKNNQDNRMISLYDTLSQSYKPLHEQESFYKQHGYVLDKDLSSRNHQALYNPEKKKMIFTVAGSRNWYDWAVNNPAILLGQFKNTDRYKSAKKAYDEAKKKYKPKKTFVSGHSQGGLSASYLASPKDRLYTYNKANFNNTIRKHETALRVKGDVTSQIGKGRKNVTTLKNKNIIYDPFGSHDLDQIKNLKVRV
jgi:hypothetical protein